MILLRFLDEPSQGLCSQLLIINDSFIVSHFRTNTQFMDTLFARLREVTAVFSSDSPSPSPSPRPSSSASSVITTAAGGFEGLAGPLGGQELKSEAQKKAKNLFSFVQELCRMCRPLHPNLREGPLLSFSFIPCLPFFFLVLEFPFSLERYHNQVHSRSAFFSFSL